MGLPTKPTLDYSYTAFQQSQGDNAFPGTEIDNDHANLKLSIDETIDFLTGSFRSDGVLKPSAYPGASDLNEYVATATAAADEASASADAAAASAVSAAASLDAFTDLYLGAKSSDPALDNDGNALQDGATYWNTSAKVLRIYDLGTVTWASGVQTSGITTDTFVGDGVEVDFELSVAPTTIGNTQVYVGGVYQEKAEYSVAGSTLTFNTAPPNGVGVQVMTFEQILINVPADGSVTAAKIASGAISSKLGYVPGVRLPFGDGSAFQMPLPEDLHYFTCSAWRDAASDLCYFAFTTGYRHEKSKYGPLVVVSSRDNGRTLVSWMTLPGFSDRGIQHASGGPMGAGRVGFLVSAVDESDVVTTHFIYTDDIAASSPVWTEASVTTSDGFFVNGPMLALPAAEGGHETLGFRWYGHSAGRIRVVSTVDNGANFTDTTIAAKPTGKTLVEPFAGLLSNGTYLVVIRDDDGGPMMTLRGTSQASLGSVIETSLALGANPVGFTEQDGFVVISPYARQGSGILGYQNAILHFAEPLAGISATGLMSTTTPVAVTAVEPACLGYPFYVTLPYGKLLVFSGGESPSGSANPSSSKVFVCAPPTTEASVTALAQPNFFRNGLFQQNSRTSPFTIDATVVTPLVDCWRWSGSGASGTATVTALDEKARLLLGTNAPTYLAFDTSGDPDDYAAIEQYLWGMDFHDLSGAVVTVSIGGIGALPGQLELVVTRIYGSGGGGSDVLPTVVFKGRALASTVWRAYATVTIPTLEGETVGTDPYLRFQIRAAGSGAWAGGFVFAKCELGDQATGYPALSPRDERTALDPYVQKISYAASKTVQGMAVGTSGANVLCVMPFARTFRVPPTVTMTGHANIRFWNTAANVNAVASAPYNISQTGFETNLTMASGTLATHAASIIQTNGGEFSYLVDAEA